MIKDFFSLAVSSLRRRKLRSWLTMIGIFIGIAAVVSLIALGQGLQDAIDKQFEQLGKDKIIIAPKSLGPPGSVTSKDLILTSKDLELIKNVRGVEWVIGILFKTELVKFKDEVNVNYVIGIEPDDLELMMQLSNLDTIDGRLLKTGDKYKAVVGYNHAYKDIWKRGIRVGDSIELLGQEFKVVGVFDKVGNPLDDAQIYFVKDSLKEVLNVEDEESQILAKTETGFNPESVGETIKRKLRQSRGEKEGEESFDIQTSEQLLETFGNIFGIVQGVLVGIASISLLVGGVGIMNTMYTSVVERTKEIGTMKAVGAKNSDILQIFLFESGLLGLIGGAIGVGLGIGLAKGAEYFAALALGTDLLKASTNPLIYLGALAFSFVIGSASGLLPALQASKLKPVDALRYE